MRRIVILQDIPQYKSYLEEVAPGWEIVFTKDRAAAREYLEGAEIIVGWTREAGERCLKEGSALRWVQTWSAGVDSMPLPLFQEHNVILTTASGVHARSISESFFAMMLSQTRGLPAALREQQKKQWNREIAPPEGLGEIHGKTVAILGTGAIGQEIARLARAFYMTTLGLRRSGAPTPYIDKVYQTQDLHQLLAEADYVVNVLPLTPATDGLMGAEAFAAMKPTAYYYNLGRGATTHTPALVEALEAGTIAGAGIDVVDPEPLPEDSPLWTMEQVLITPHMSGTTPYYADRVMDIFATNLKDYIAGEPLSRNVVSYSESY